MQRKEHSLSTRDLGPDRAATAGGEAATGEAAVRDSGQVLDSPAASEFDARTGGSGAEAVRDSGAETERAGEPVAGVAEGAVSEAPGGVAVGATAENDDSGPLMDTETGAGFQRRWQEVQTRFVDEPRDAVEEADSLVANVMRQLAETFAQERERLEAQWARGEDISTEDLRVALQRYRSFFRRLLST
jgi:hypothetical protein